MLALVFLALIAHDTAAREFFEKLALAYTVLWIAFLPLSSLSRMGKLGDCSLGLYVYAYPVQQTIGLLWPDIGPITLFVFATVITLPLAVLSWHFVERTALAQRVAVVKWINAKAVVRARVPVR